MLLLNLSLNIRISVPCKPRETVHTFSSLRCGKRATPDVICATLDQMKGLIRVRIFSSLSPYILLNVIEKEGLSHASVAHVSGAWEVSGAGSLDNPI